MYTPAVAHDMHRAHPLTLLVEEHLQRMHLPRRSQIVYQQLPIALRIPLRMHHCLHLTWQPLFAMQALLEMPVSQQITVRNRACRLVPFSETRAEIKRSSSLLYLLSIASRDLWPTVFHHEVICKWLRKACDVMDTKFRYARCSDTHRHIKSHRPASSHVRRPHWNRCTVVHLCLCPDFLIHVAATHTFLTLQRRTGMISYSFSYSYSGKQIRRKTRKWQVIRTDRWRFTKSSFRNLFRNRLHWCPMLPVITRKTTRTIHTIPRRRILRHFWDTQNVTVSALSWSMPF